MNIESAEIKTRILILNNILIDISQQRNPNNAYLYNTIYK